MKEEESTLKAEEAAKLTSAFASATNAIVNGVDEEFAPTKDVTVSLYVMFLGLPGLGTNNRDKFAPGMTAPSAVHSYRGTRPPVPVTSERITVVVFPHNERALGPLIFTVGAVELELVST